MPEDRLWFTLLGLSVLLNLFLCIRLYLRHLADKEKVSENEILAMVEEGEELGAIGASEKELIENVFAFNNITAEDVMVHRTDIVMISQNATRETVLHTILTSGLSRFPVHGEDADDIIGILSTREYLLNIHQEEEKTIKQMMRPAYFVPERVRADVLFRDMQSKKIHVAMVVDEYGGTSGLVTLEDLIEELVGNIYDEFDPQDEQEIIPLEDGTWRVSGGADLEMLCREIGVSFPEEDLDFDTLGGLVFTQLSVIPDDGSCPEVYAMGMRIRVEVLKDRRVEWAVVEKTDTQTHDMSQQTQEEKLATKTI